MVVLTQGSGESERPIVFLGRKSTLTERKLTPLERLVRAVWWGMHKLARYTAFEHTEIIVHDESLLAVLKLAGVHRSLEGFLADLSGNRISWAGGPSFFQYCMDWLNM